MSKRGSTEIDCCVSFANKRVARQDHFQHRPSLPNDPCGGVASPDDQLIQHMLSTAAASSGYAHSPIYHHWSERMRGGWQWRKLVSSADVADQMDVH